MPGDDTFYEVATTTDEDAIDDPLAFNGAALAAYLLTLKSQEAVR